MKLSSVALALLFGLIPSTQAATFQVDSLDSFAQAYHAIQQWNLTHGGQTSGVTPRFFKKFNQEAFSRYSLRLKQIPADCSEQIQVKFGEQAVSKELWKSASGIEKQFLADVVAVEVHGCLNLKKVTPAQIEHLVYHTDFKKRMDPSEIADFWVDDHSHRFCEAYHAQFGGFLKKLSFCGVTQLSLSLENTASVGHDWVERKVLLTSNESSNDTQDVYYRSGSVAYRSTPKGIETVMQMTGRALSIPALFRGLVSQKAANTFYESRVALKKEFHE